MKKLSYIVFLIIIIGCNPDGIGCFNSSGSIETVTVEVADFSVIDVSGNIEVHLTSAAVKDVKLIAGSNIIPGIRLQVIDGILFLDNLNTCNWTREYVNPIVEISNPALTKVVQHGFGEIISNGTLTYNELTLENTEGSGDFKVDVNVQKLTIVSNEVANFYLRGSADLLVIGFYYADEIFYGEELQVDDCLVTHYGSNSMHLNVTQSLKGNIYSYGDVFMHRQMPQTIEVTESENGKLIFDL
jgi:hypothetical protein